MELRRYRPHDLSSLLELYNAARANDHEFIPRTETQLKTELDQAGSIWLATERERLIGAAIYYPRWYGDEIVPITAPDVDGEQVQTELLGRVEVDATGGEAVVAVAATRPAQMAFLESLGYAAEGGLIQLVTDLQSERSIPSLPDGCRLRRLEPNEEADFVEMVNTAYDAERLSLAEVERWRSYRDWTEAWVHVVDDGERLVAGVVARPDQAHNEFFGANRGYLGPAAVIPGHGRQGLGRALTAASLNFVRSQGMDHASLYTTQSNRAVHRLTEQLGFWIAHEWTFMKKGV